MKVMGFRWFRWLLVVGLGGCAVPGSPPVSSPMPALQAVTVTPPTTSTTTTVPAVEGPFKPSYPFVAAPYQSCPRVVGQRVWCKVWIAKPLAGVVTWAIPASRCDYDQSPMPPPDLSLIGNPPLAGSSGWCPPAVTVSGTLWPACHCFEVVTPNPRQFISDCDCFYPDEP